MNDPEENVPIGTQRPAPPPHAVERTFPTVLSGGASSSAPLTRTPLQSKGGVLGRAATRLANFGKSKKGYQEVSRQEESNFEFTSERVNEDAIYEELTEEEMEQITSKLEEIKTLVQSNIGISNNSLTKAGEILLKIAEVTSSFPDSFKTKFRTLYDSIAEISTEVKKFQDGKEYDINVLKNGINTIKEGVQGLAGGQLSPELISKINVLTTSVENITNATPEFSRQVQEIHNAVVPPPAVAVPGDLGAPENARGIMDMIRNNSAVLTSVAASMEAIRQQVQINSTQIRTLERGLVYTNNQVRGMTQSVTGMTQSVTGISQSMGNLVGNPGDPNDVLKPEFKITPWAYHISKQNYRLSFEPSLNVKLGEDGFLKKLGGGIMVNCSTHLVSPTPYGDGKGTHQALEYISKYGNFKTELGQTDGESYWTGKLMLEPNSPLLGSFGFGIGSKNVIPECGFVELNTSKQDLPFNASFQHPFYNSNPNSNSKDGRSFLESNFNKIETNFSKAESNLNDKFNNTNNLVERGFTENNNLVKQGFKETVEKDCCEDLKQRFNDVDSKLDDIVNNNGEKQSNLEPLAGILGTIALVFTRKSLLIVIVGAVTGVISGVIYYVLVRASKKIKNKSSLRYIALISIRFIFSSGAIFTSGLILINVLVNVIRGLSPFLEGGFLNPQNGLSKYVDIVINKIPETTPTLFNGKLILFSSKLLFLGLYGSHLVCIYLKVTNAVNPVMGFYQGLFIIVVHLRYVSTIYYIQEFDRTKSNTYLPVLFGLSLKATIDYYVNYIQLIKEVISLIKPASKPKLDKWKLTD